MASIFDILGNGPLGMVLDAMKGGANSPFGSGANPFDTGTSRSDFGASSRNRDMGGGLGGGLGSGLGAALQNIANQARNTASTIQNQTPGGMGGLLGAGALGAILGNLMSSDAVKGVALAGAGAVAWNFYKKWAAQKQAAEDAPSISHNQFGDAPASHGASPMPSQSLPQHVDPTAELVIRSMVYAAKADGNIDSDERKRIHTVLSQMLPGKNVDAVIENISMEALDPARIAALISAPGQADDVYRLSCATIDIDHFMERGYLDALAKTLGISPSQQKQIENEAVIAKKQLLQAASA